METLKALIPTAGVVFIFWLAVRGLIQADRRERAAQARFAASRDARVENEIPGQARNAEARTTPAEPTAESEPVTDTTSPGADSPDEEPR